MIGCCCKSESVVVAPNLDTEAQITVPSADELREGKRAIERVRDIEPDDLLGREPVQLDEAGCTRWYRNTVWFSRSTADPMICH